MRVLKILFLLSFLSFSFLAPSFASDKGILLTEEVQLKIADTFMKEGEYYRAITEYKKFLILFPEAEKADYAAYRVGIAYYAGEEYESSAHSFSLFRKDFPRSQYVPMSYYYEGLGYWKLRRYEEAKTSFASLAGSYPESEVAPSALIASSLVSLETGDIASCREDLERVASQYPRDPRTQNAHKAIKLVEEYKDLPEKSRILAGIMSAVIPGSGYIYAKHYGDGITAFVINALFIAGTVTAVKNENYAVAGIVGGIGLPFYFGNIYGSANAAKKWNLGIRKEARNRIFITLDFSL